MIASLIDLSADGMGTTRILTYAIKQVNSCKVNWVGICWGVLSGMLSGCGRNSILHAMLVHVALWLKLFPQLSRYTS